MTDGRKALLIILGAFSVCALVVIAVVIVSKRPQKEPEQIAQVEVIGKRTHTSHSTKGSTSTFYLVNFKFLGGDEKEFKITSKTRSAAEIYNSMQEGDTGTLTYKELKNATKFDHRFFVSFEKD